jgi:predicted acyl esterase
VQVKLIDFNPATNESRLISDGSLRMRLVYTPGRACQTPRLQKHKLTRCRRCRWREGGAKMVPIEAGEVYEVVVGVSNTSYIFGKGHSIR